MLRAILPFLPATRKGWAILVTTILVASLIGAGVTSLFGGEDTPRAYTTPPRTYSAPSGSSSLPASSTNPDNDPYIAGYTFMSRSLRENPFNTGLPTAVCLELSRRLENEGRMSDSMGIVRGCTDALRAAKRGSN